MSLLARQTNRGNKSRDVIIPAPVLGLNARDAVSAMQPLYALKMDNYFPLGSSVVLRNGYEKFLTLGTAGTGIQALVAYKKPNNNKMLAVYDKKIYNASATNAGTAYAGITLTDSNCQTVQYKDYLYFMNGSDTPIAYYIDSNNAEQIGAWGFSGTNLTASRIIAGAVSKERLWFVEKDTLKAWFGAAGNISGTLKAFDLQQVAKCGGTLIAVANWTLDGGQGIDDLTVFITSEGEVLVYAGSNPEDADDWSLKGSYRIAKPIGYNCTMKYQGDIVIITEDGYMPLGKMLSVSNSGETNNIFSDVIRELVLSRTELNKSKRGWQSIIFSKKGYALFNVPNATQFEQHVINVNTGAWCRWTINRSFCWCVFDDNLYFGADDVVYKMNDGYSDNEIEIEGVIEQAYNTLGTPAIKKINLINPRTKCSAQYKLVIYTNTDFKSRNVNYVTSIGTVGKSLWNVALWSNISAGVDAGYKWGSNYDATLLNSQWVANSAVGSSISVVFKTKTSGNKIEWYDTAMRYELGNGIL